MTDSREDVYAANVVTRSGTSFYWAMRFLPESQRHAMYALYAFCREVDDIADGELSSTEKQAQLKDWRDEVNRLPSHGAQHPIVRALDVSMRPFAMNTDDLHAIINGMETDARGHVRMADDVALDVYCDQVASAVGRVVNGVFGVQGEESEKLAFSLGRAMQLTNILRDVDEDARENRLYLPLDRLAAYGLAGTDELTTADNINVDVLSSQACEKVCLDLAAQADGHFARAQELLDALGGRRRIRPAAIMLSLYRRLLQKLLRRGWQYPRQPIGLARWEKLCLSLCNGVL